MEELTPYNYKAKIENLRLESKLARFPSPEGAAQTTVRHTCTEFTHLCPFTGHPDYAEIQIEFRPLQYCVELKALKLYLQEFRNIRIPYEALIPIIYSHLEKCMELSEGRLRVAGKWRGRGGITSEVEKGCLSD